jgi:hypothetical protein
MSHSEFLFQKFEKTRVQGAGYVAIKRIISAISSFLLVDAGDEQKERNEAQPHAPAKELAALCNPAYQAA